MEKPITDGEEGGESRFYFRPLIALLISFICGILLAHCFPGHLKAALLLSGFSAVLVCYAVFTARPVKWRPLMLFGALGYLSLCPWHFAPEDPAHISRFLDKNPRQITGRIASEPIRQDFRWKFTLSRIQLASLQAAGDPVAVKGGLKVSVYGKPSRQPVKGDTITFPGKIRALHNFNNPGGFDYKAFMAHKNIWGSTYCSAKNLHVHPSKPEMPPISAVIQAKRQAAAHLIDASAGGDARAILSTLVLGNRQLLPQELKEAFNRAGASHILAISGLHIGIVATAAFLLFKHLALLCPPLLKRGLAVKTAAVLTIFPVWGYGLLAGMAPSTQRAVIMASLFLLSFLIEREHDLINTLAIAALVILAIFPPALFSVSFQLSFTAVAAIVWGLSAIEGSGPAMRFPAPVKSLLSFMAVSFFAIMGTTPLVMHYFNQVAFFGILTNLLIIPVIGFIVVPLALFAVLVMLPVSEAMAGWMLKLAGTLIDGVLPAIYRIAELPFSSTKTITPSLLELACGYVLFFSCLMLIKKKGDGSSGEKPKLSQIFLIMVLAAGILAADIGYVYHQRFRNAHLRVTILDVGQGSAALIELPGGSRMLIDGGGFSSNKLFDIGKNVVAPFLWHRKIGTLDTVVLSHPDADHLNGLLYILKHFNVKKVLSTHQEADSLGYQQFTRTIRDRQIPHPDYANVPRRFQINGAAIAILYPPAHKSAGAIKNPNNHSLVLKIEYQGHSILFPGDIMGASEKSLAAEAAGDLASTILVAPHHGSKTSNTPQFLEAVDAELVIVSAGHQNRFDLPSPCVLERYRAKNYKILDTATNGALQITMDKGRLILRPVLGDPVELIDRRKKSPARLLGTHEGGESKRTGLR